MFQASGYLPESVEDKLRKLEADKQSLALQVSALKELALAKHLSSNRAKRPNYKLLNHRFGLHNIPLVSYRIINLPNMCCFLIVPHDLSRDAACSHRLTLNVGGRGM